MPPEPAPSPRMGFFYLTWDKLFCCSFSRTCSSSTRPQECLRLLEGNSAWPLLLHRLALDICLESSHHSSLMKSSCCTWVNMLGAIMYLPLYISSVTCRRLDSQDPLRACTLWCSGAVSVGSRGSPQEHL